MAELKTRPNDASVTAFLNGVADERKRQDSFELLELMREATGEEPQMWGDSIIGFGRYQYRYASGRQGEWFLAGFSPRKQNLTVYVMAGFTAYDDLLANLGQHRTGKSCLSLKRLDDIDRKTLTELVRQSAAHVAESNA